ncbi:hypothetical protein [Thiobacillus sp.]|uniref:hypothetical protein n=1 Tax=Thiobacillus sp. TaxID=924 RepID=UPI0025DBDB00|nr:hypothetical protein [Thiobacillus sp.]
MNIQKTIANTFTSAMRWIACLGLLSALGLPTAALAHSNEYLATIKGDHGGLLRMVEMYHFELVVKEGEVQVWATDHGDVPQSTQGANASLRFIAGTQTLTVKLNPAGTNELVGKDSRIRLAASTKIVLTVTMKGQKPLQVRYLLGDSKADHAGKH